jgi:hypothetical protein
MNDQEKLSHLIDYLKALAEISEKSDVKVFSEITRTIKEIDKLINQ